RCSRGLLGRVRELFLPGVGRARTVGLRAGDGDRDNRDRADQGVGSWVGLHGYTRDGRSDLTADANISRAQPETARAMPTANPMSVGGEVGQCGASIARGGSEARPDTSAQPQLPNRTMLAATARKMPPAMK